MKRRSKIHAIADDKYEEMLHVLNNKRELLKCTGQARKTLIQKCRRGKLTLQIDPETNHSIIMTRKLTF